MRAHERLIDYTRFATASDAACPACPSTESQREFGRYLVDEMKALGIQDATIDQNGYVYGTIPGNVPHKAPVVGFIAHMDVVRDVPYENIKTRVVEQYDGGDIVLNAEQNIVMRAADFAHLAQYKGCDLLVTDGTTLLGADDKAGIAEILTMAEVLLNDASIPHGDIKIGFTPDEEIGRGADLFDIPYFGADFAYTVDGAAFGGVEYENFNAAQAVVSICGKNIHPGSAKNMMKNALTIACELDGMLPCAQRPQHTAGYEGFYHLTHLEGIVDEAKMQYILRDHDAGKLEEKKEMLTRAVAFLNHKYGAGTLSLDIRDQYRNMRELLGAHMHLIETAYEAIAEAGGKPVSLPIRGGTDGATLTYMGLPCPNLATGSHNHHGKMEFAVLQSMDNTVNTLIKIAQKYGAKQK